LPPALTLAGGRLAKVAFQIAVLPLSRLPKVSPPGVFE